MLPVIIAIYFPLFSMADNDSGSSVIVAIVAIIVIVAIGFIALQMFPMDNGGGQINVELPAGSTGGNGQ